MILVIDNYDSFVYNLVQYISEMSPRVKVVRNDDVSVGDIEKLRPAAIVVSPGPRTPAEAGISVAAIKHFAGRVPLFGVCLGHQSIGAAFGARVIRAKKLMHGKTSPISHDGKTIFRGLPNPFEATRYHSLVVEKRTLPACFEISATAPDGQIMGLRLKKSFYGPSRRACLEGVQFHPESILTVDGKKIVRNFLAAAPGSGVSK